MSKRGGKRAGAGRKSKDTEMVSVKNAIAALEVEFGSQKDAFQFLAKQSRNSFNHFKLLLEYAYGQPQKNIDLTSDGKEIKIPKFVIESE